MAGPIQIKYAGIDFGEALNHLKRGRRVTRAGWNGEGMWLALRHPNPDDAMNRAFIFIKDAQGGLVPWLASQTDMLAEDWEVLPDEDPTSA